MCMGQWLKILGGKTEVESEKYYTVWVVVKLMLLEQWWEDTDRGNLKYWEKNVIQIC